MKMILLFGAGNVGCHGVRLGNKLKQAGFLLESREYIQQMFFPSEVILAVK